eukprot:PITA_27419
MVTGMPKFDINHEAVCQGYAVGKLTRGPFPSSESQTIDILQLVHSNLSGMLHVTSLGGYLYYAIFADDFSHKTWIYFLNKKDEVFKWFRSSKALVEKQTGKKIKILRTNNGAEYESYEFNDFCREVGIKNETIVPYTPEQNGAFEKKNRTIMEATHAMRHDQGLPKFLWGEVSNTTVHIESVPGQRDMEVSHDVTFDEDNALGKARDLPIPRKDNDDDAEKQDEPPTDEPMPDVEGPINPIDPPPGDPSTSTKRPLWLKDAKRRTTPRGTFRESKKPNKYQGYLVAMSTIVQTEPCSFEEAIKHQVCKDAMNEENESIMMNDVWDVVPRLKDKSCWVVLCSFHD